MGVEERERETETETETERQRDRDRDTEREGERRKNRAATCGIGVASWFAVSVLGYLQMLWFNPFTARLAAPSLSKLTP